MTKHEIQIELQTEGEVFTHRDDAGVFRTFAVETMFKTATKYGGKCDEIMNAKLPMMKHHVRHVRKKMGIEPKRLNRLVAPWLYLPLIAIEWAGTPNGITIVDGNHRMVKLYAEGAREFLCYIFKAPFWENFVIPPELLPRDENHLKGDSRMLEYEKRKQSSGEGPIRHWNPPLSD